jgi:hypothetical protein
VKKRKGRATARGDQRIVKKRIEVEKKERERRTKATWGLSGFPPPLFILHLAVLH